MKTANIYDLEMTLWKKFFVTLDDSYHKSCKEIEMFANFTEYENGKQI